MVRRASFAHHWIGAPNHPERANESERIEGLPWTKEENTTGIPVGIQFCRDLLYGMCGAGYDGLGQENC